MNEQPTHAGSPVDECDRFNRADDRAARSRSYSGAKKWHHCLHHEVFPRRHDGAIGHKKEKNAMGQDRPGRPGVDFDWRAFTPEDSPKTFPDVLADPRHRDLTTAKLAVGDRAYDFELASIRFRGR